MKACSPRFQKRFAHRYQFIASYALQRATTDNVDVWNNLNYVTAVAGQYLAHHQLRSSPVWRTCRGASRSSLNSTYISTTPR